MRNHATKAWWREDTAGIVAGKPFRIALIAALINEKRDILSDKKLPLALNGHGDADSVTGGQCDRGTV